MARTNKSRVPALAYYRTSSAANVGNDKDSEKRQRQAIESLAKRGGFEIVAKFIQFKTGLASPSSSTGSMQPASPPRTLSKFS